MRAPIRFTPSHLFAMLVLVLGLSLVPAALTQANGRGSRPAVARAEGKKKGASPRAVAARERTMAKARNRQLARGLARSRQSARAAREQPQAQPATPRRYTRRAFERVRGIFGGTAWKLRMKTNAGVPEGTYAIKNLRTGELTHVNLGPNAELTLQLGNIVERAPWWRGGVRWRVGDLGAKAGDRIRVIGPDGYRFTIEVPAG